jgi:hypothetical protein
MKITVREAGEYFRGLLLLVSADHRVTHQEQLLLERAGKSLGLEQEFCREAMREILDNPWVEVSPPYFSDRTLAESFVRDGLMLANSDGSMHAVEIAWLRKVAEMNGLTPEWFDRERGEPACTGPGAIQLNVEGAVLTYV